MALRYKQPVGYRQAYSRTPAPEAFEIVGGKALLAEAPADPANPATPMAVTVGGVPYVRVTAAPAPGEYRVRTAVVQVGGQSRTEWQPVLEFHASVADDTAGTCDYYRGGTIHTPELEEARIAHDATLIVAMVDELPPPSLSYWDLGYKGRQALALSDASLHISTGTEWVQIAGAMGGGVVARLVGVEGRGNAAAVGVQTGAVVLVESVSGKGEAGPITASISGEDFGAVALLDAVSGKGDAAAVSAVGSALALLSGVSGKGGAVAVSAITGALVSVPAVSGAGGAVAISAVGNAAADTTAPSVGTLSVPDTTGTAITGINPGTSTDAVGIVGWKIIEQDADTGWPTPGTGATAPGAAGWNTIASTTSWAPGAVLSFTSAASSTGVRYFRLYLKDAAGNVGASATDSATVTIGGGAIGVYAQAQRPGYDSTWRVTIRSGATSSLELWVWSDYDDNLFFSVNKIGAGAATLANTVAWSGSYIRIEHDDGGGEARVRSGPSSTGPWTTQWSGSAGVFPGGTTTSVGNPADMTTGTY